MNSDSLILRELINSPLTTKNDFLTNGDFDNNLINIYSDLVALCVTTGVIAFDEFETYDDTVLNYSTYNGRLYNYINASPSIGVTPSTDVNYWIEVFPTILAHKQNADTVLNEGGANEVTAAEIRAFIDAGLTTTTNLAITTKTATTFLLTSSTGADVTIPAASRTEAGLLIASDKSKLDQLNGVNTGDQSLISLGAEATANKATSFSTLNDVLFPTVQAVETQIVAKIDALVNAAPSALDTLNELAAALGDDANYAATMTSALATKEATANKQNSLVVDGTGVKFPTVDAVNLAINAIPSGITVGTTPITSGTVGRVLFEGTGNVLQQSANLTFNGSSLQLTGRIGLNVATNSIIDFNMVGSAGTYYGHYASGTYLQAAFAAPVDTSTTPTNFYAPACGNSAGYKAENSGAGATVTGIRRGFSATDFNNSAFDNVAFYGDISNSGGGRALVLHAVNGNALIQNGSITVGNHTNGAKLDVKAGGALSTDVVQRWRNSADSANLGKLTGDGAMTLGTYTNPSTMLSINTNGTGAYIGGLKAVEAVGNASGTAYGVDALGRSTTSGGTSYGVNSIADGSTGNAINYGGKFTASGAGLTNYAGYFDAISATNNWAIYVQRGNIGLDDANNIQIGTTTGTKIGTATTQKLSFWNATPIVQPTTSIASATLASLGGTALTDTDTFDGYTLKQIVKALRNSGLLA